jgi:hypothetical protein
MFEMPVLSSIWAIRDGGEKNNQEKMIFSLTSSTNVEYYLYI